MILVYQKNIEFRQTDQLFSSQNAYTQCNELSACKENTGNQLGWSHSSAHSMPQDKLKLFRVCN